LLFLFCSPAIVADETSRFKAVTATEVERLQNGVATCEITPNSSITQEISGGESRTCQIQLNAHQYLQLFINKGDLELALTFYAPSGEKLFEYIDHYYGALELSLIVELPGVQRLEVRSLEKEPASKSYELSIEQLRSATARDVKDGSALKLFAEAHNLRAQWEETSLRKALEKFMQARLLWLSASQPRKAIRALTSAAEVHFTLGEYRQSLGLYKKALAENRRISEHQGELESINQLGRVYGYLGDNDEAEKYFAKVLHYYEQQSYAHLSAQDKRLNAEAFSNMGEVSYSKGDLIRALDFINRSLALWSDVGDRRGEAQARLILGYALTYSGDHAKALGQFNQAMTLYHAVEDRKGEALSLTAIGSLHSLSGEEQLALDSHLEAMRTFRRIGDHQSEAVTLNGVGQAYEDLNEKLTALDNYKQALSLFEANESLDFAAGTEYEIARLYRSMNEIQQALAHYNRCISLSRRTKKRRAEAYALNDIAAIYDSQGRRGETLRQYDKILKLYRQVGDLRGQALTLKSIGDLFFAAGEKQKALGFYKQSLPLIQASGDREGETSTLYNIARAARDCGALDDALSQIEQSLQIIETLRTYVSSPALRSSYFASVHKHYGLYIDLLMQLDGQRPGKGFSAMALRASESARARSLLEILGEVNANIRQGVDQGLLEQEQRFEQLLNAKAQYQVQLSSSKQTQAEAAELAREIRHLTTEYQVVQSQLREQSPRYATLIHPRPLNLNEIQAEIRDDNTLLLEYFLGEERSYLWVVSSDSFSSYELPARARLEDAAREVYGLLTTRQQVGEKIDASYQERVRAADRQYGEKGLALSRMLLGPAASQLGNKRLLIVTEGALQYIPFEALPVPDAEPVVEPSTAGGSSDDVSLLISRHEIVSLPSISTLAAIRSERPPGNSPPKVVAILADPVFETDDPRVQKPGDLVASAAPVEAQPADTQRALKDFDEATGRPHIPRLPYTLQETDAIVAVTQSDERMVATGFEASRETVINSQLNQYQVVHFATHGLINDEHPELSGILLSLVDRSGKQERGFLQLHDIYNLNLSAKLVVLSACRTGLGEDIKGEGLVGLTRGFMYAGSKGVVASLWKVDDRATAELMGHFYRAMLKDNLPPAAALRVAKEALRKQNQWRAPYFWAAFVLQGEYRERVQVTDARRYSTYIIAASLAALSCLLCLLYVKRRRGR
jgi:CHAT domain-containing protein/tetratricopeptide (TPR) repeat protein